MLSRSEQMAEKYLAKLRLGAGGKSLTVPSDVQVRRFQVAMEKQNFLTGQVKSILGSAGVSTIMYTSYHAYAREVDKLTRMEISHDSLVKEVQITLTKWVARGLTQSVLQTIRTQLFNIPAPLPPEV